MKIALIPLIILCIFACSNPQQKTRKQESNLEQETVGTVQETAATDKNREELRFKETIGQAVLIGETIELLDNKLNAIKDISNLSGKIVEITGISDSLFNQSSDFCKAYWYVKIQTGNISGIVNGRQVFKILKSSQDTVFIADDNQIEILTTGFLGMGVEFEGELMGCPVDQPVIIKDKKRNYFGLVYLIQNEYSKKAKWNNEYPYFELRSDDGRYDKIKTIAAEGTRIRLRIHRSLQDGANDYEVLLSFEDNKYKAEYLNYPE